MAQGKKPQGKRNVDGIDKRIPRTKLVPPSSKRAKKFGQEEKKTSKKNGNAAKRTKGSMSCHRNTKKYPKKGKGIKEAPGPNSKEGKKKDCSFVHHIGEKRQKKHRQRRGAGRGGNLRGEGQELGRKDTKGDQNPRLPRVWMDEIKKWEKDNQRTQVRGAAEPQYHSKTKRGNDISAMSDS